MSPKRIATMLKRVRKAKGLTQLELSKRSRVAQGYISELEAGREKNPGVETLRKLAKALGVAVTELLG